MSGTSRRSLLGGALLGGALALPATARAQPAAPVRLTVLVATEGVRMVPRMLQDFAARHPDLVSGVEQRDEETSWLGAGLTEEVRAGQSSVDVVLSNTGGFALGAVQEIWQAQPPALREASPPPTGRMLQDLVGETGMVFASAHGGPALLHRRAALATAPRSAAELLDYARQNPGRFQYARPRESQFGQAFVMAIPHLLRDPDPGDPQSGWRRAWDYLEELGRHAAYYPSSGTAALEEFAEGGVDLTPCLIAIALLAQGSGLLPPTEAGTAVLDDGPLLPHGFVLSIPRGVPAARMPAIAALARHLLTPDVQMREFGRGLLPGAPEGPVAAGPAVTAAQRATWNRALTPELSAALAGRAVAPPLASHPLLYMLRRWNEQIGARHGEGR